MCASIGRPPSLFYSIYSFIVIILIFLWGFRTHPLKVIRFRWLINQEWLRSSLLAFAQLTLKGDCSATGTSSIHAVQVIEQ